MNRIAKISERLALILLVASLAVQPSLAGMGQGSRTSPEVPGYLAVLLDLVTGLVAPFLA